MGLHTREEFDRLEERVEVLKSDYDEAVREIRRLVQAKADLQEEVLRLQRRVAMLEGGDRDAD